LAKLEAGTAVGAGFDKPADTNYFTLRFPRICEVHDDRTYKDSISFEELQQVAKQNSTPPKDGNIRIEKEWLSKLNMDEQIHRNKHEEWVDTESEHVSETTSEQTHLDKNQFQSQIQPELPPGQPEDVGAGVLRYVAQRTPSVTPSSVDIRSLKRQLLAPPDAEPIVPTKRHKGCIPPVTRSLHSSSSKAARQQSPSSAPEGEMVESRNIVLLRSPPQQQSIGTSEVDKDRTQAQPCIKSTMPILLGNSLSAHNLRLQDICRNINLTFTFCTDYFVRTMADHRHEQSDEANQQRPYFMVAVDWSRPDKALSDVAIFASSVQTHNVSDAALDHCIVTFVDWNVLVHLDKSGEIEARELQRMTKGTMTIRDGVLIRFQYDVLE
jgi:hypothetical protein